jgi:uncharacterized membrane protein YfcA
VLPHVSSATTSVMSFFNSSASVAHYLAIGAIPLEIGIYSFIIGALGGIIGRLTALFVAARYKRPSTFIFFLVGVMLVSLCVYSYELASSPADYSFHGGECV